MTPSTGAFEIRAARPSDLPALAALEQATFAEPWSAAALAGFWESPGARAWLALDPAGAAVGFALFAVVPHALEAELLRVGTAPEWKRAGVASGLLRAALAELDRLSIATFLEVRADNFAALALYRRLGFEPCGLRQAYYPDGCDAWLFLRKI